MERREQFISHGRSPDLCSPWCKRTAFSVSWVLCAVLLATPTWGQAVRIYPNQFDMLEGSSDDYAYSIVLRSQPTADVTVTLTSQVPTGTTVTITPTMLTFTTGWSTEGAGGWDERQRVTITSTRDNKDLDNATVTITHAVASEDARYDGIAPAYPSSSTYGYVQTGLNAVTVTIWDDDVSNVTITPASFDVWENDDHEYAVVLDTEPMGDVTVTLSSPAGLAVAPTAPLTFTPARGVAGGWNTAQTVTVSAGADAGTTGETRTIRHAVTSADDAAYNALADREVVVNVLDGDVVVISHSALEVDEGSVGSYTVQLRSRPSATVTVAVTMATQGTSPATAAPTTLKFTATNWNRPQSVRITGVRNDAVSGDEILTITHQATSTDPQYNAARVRYVYQDGNNVNTDKTELTVTIDDNEGIFVAPTEVAMEYRCEGHTLSDGRREETYTWLGGQYEMHLMGPVPSANVTVTPSASPDGVVQLSTGRGDNTLVFTRANYKAVQTVTVVPREGVYNTTVTVTHAPSGGEDYSSATIMPVQIALGGRVACPAADESPPRVPWFVPVGIGGIIRPAVTEVAVVSLPRDGSDTYGAGETIRIRISFTDDVRIFGTPQLKIRVGDQGRLADLVYTPTWPRDEVLFEYTVQPGDSDGDGIETDDELHANNYFWELDPGDWVADSHGVVHVGKEYRGLILTNAKVDTPTVRARAGDDQRVMEQDAVTLDGSGSSAAGGVEIASYQWRAAPDNDIDVVLANANEAVATFTLPNLSSPVVLTFVLTVTGDGGQTDADEVVVTSDVEAEVVRMVVASTPEAGSDTYRLGETIEIRVSFSSPVRVTGTPQLRLSIGDEERLANLAETPTGPVSALLFEYVVQPGDRDGDGIETGDDPWKLDAGDAIIDNVSENAAMVPDAYKEFTLTSAKIDASDVEAEVTHVAVASTPEAGSDTYRLGETIEIRVSFSSPVRVTGTPQLRLSIGDEERLANLAETPTGPVSALLFEYVVQPGDRDGDGIETGDDPWKLDAGDAIIGNASGTAAMVPDAYKEFTLTNAKIDTSAVHARAGDDRKVMEQDVVTLDGSGSSAVGGAEIAAYQWRAAAGNEVDVVLANADEAVATFTLPNLPAPVTLTFVLTVTGDGGQTDADEVVVEVDAVNDTPKADAGDSRDEQEGTEVTLDGSGSRDPEGEQLRYAWRLKSGGSSYVTMPSDLTTAWVVVNLGVNIPDETELTFELEVTDPGDASHAADVVITVRSTPFGEVLSHALSRFGQALGSSAVGTLGERFNNTSRRAPGTVAVNAGGTQLNLSDLQRKGAAHIAGSPSDTPRSDAAMSGPLFANHFDERLRAGSRHLPGLDRDFLMRSNFEIGLGGDDVSGPDRVGADRVEAEGSVDWAFWGRFDSRGFEATPTEAVALDGSVSVGYLGADARFGTDGETIIGLALARAGSDVAFRQDGLEGDISLGMLGFYPYGGWSPSEAVSLWGMLGAGSGEAELTTDEEHELATDIGMMMLAGGGRGDLRPVGMVNLAVTGDAYLVNTTADAVADRALGRLETNVQRLRLGLEGSLQLPVSGASMLRPSIALSGRLDGGDAETGFGVEVNASIAYENAMGWTLDGRMRRLLTHTDAGIAETAFSAMVRYDPGGPGGPSIALAPTWGDMQSVAPAMWHGDRPMFGGLPGTGEVNGASASRTRSLNAELQYGIPLRSWMIAPYGTLNMHGASDHERWGVRIEALALPRGNLSADLFGERPDGRRGAAMDPGVQATVRLLLD